MRRVILAGASALVVLVVPTAFATDAGANPAALTCGQTVTHSIVLTHDLLNCQGDGLKVGASHITVDLNGHLIDGVNAAGSIGVNDNG
ncbi:MAG TPA: hypothetical protein VGD55_12795, partial [Acidothermaceae bacterium]